MNLLLTLLVNVLFGVLASHLAQKRGRDGVTWFIMGVLLGIIGIVLLYLLPSQGKQEPIGPTKTRVATSEASSNDTNPFDGWARRPNDNEPSGVIMPEPLVEPSIAPGASHMAKLAYYKSKDWYYIDQQHVQQGPVAYEDIRLAYTRDRLFPTTYIWCDGMAAWLRLQEVPEIFEDLLESRN